VTQVYLSIGSNLDRERHINAGVRELQQLFGHLRLSSVYESEAVGFEGENFFNMAAGFSTHKSLSDLADSLRAIEYRYGRPTAEKVFGNRYLDIDILTYGDANGEFFAIKLPRSDIADNAYMLAPLAEIAPHARHPVMGQNYQELWQQFDRRSQKLWRINFSWIQPEHKALDTPSKIPAPIEPVSFNLRSA